MLPASKEQMPAIVWCDCRSAESPAQQRWMQQGKFDSSDATGSYPSWSCCLTSCLFGTKSP